MYGLICGESLEESIVRRTKIYQACGVIYYTHTKCPSCGKMEMELVDPVVLYDNRRKAKLPKDFYVVEATYQPGEMNWDQVLKPVHETKFYRPVVVV